MKYLAALSGSVIPPDRPKTLAALKFRLREGAGQGTSRGPIIDGDKIGAATRTVEFQAEATPVMSATITYYKP
jgi:hypothetical protein